MIRAVSIALTMMCLLLTGCGYRFGSGGLEHRYHSICVPYVEADREGILTQMLVRSLVAHSRLRYVTSSGDLVLHVQLQEPYERTIGFDFAQKENRKRTHVLVSNEARLTASARFSVVDCKRAIPILGPIEVSSSIDYDYEPDLTRSDVTHFSLGQLKMHNASQESALNALYMLLAEQIVDYIQHCPIVMEV